MTTPTAQPTPASRQLDTGLQRVDVKIPIDLPDGVWQDPICDKLLAVFGRWRTEEGEDIVDLQDYSHVTSGPGVILVSKRWVLSVDFNPPGPGILLSVRRRLSGALADRLETAVRLTCRKAARLLAESEMQGMIEPRADSLLVTINDRPAFPNTDEACDEVAPALEEALRRIGGGEPYLAHDATPKRRLAFQAAIGCPEGTTLQQLAGDVD